MKIRVLGARQGESQDSHFGSLLVDGTLALDAGRLTGGLSLAEQLALTAVLVTHHHLDHIKDLATLGFNLFIQKRRIAVLCSEQVRETLEATLLSPRIWIDFFQSPEDAPTFQHTPIGVGSTFSLDGKQIRLIEVPHSVPTLGVELISPEGRSVLYTSDNGLGAGKAWAATRPDLLITETTYPDSETAAAEHGHLTPALLAAELSEFRGLQGYLPRVLVVHVNPFSEDSVSAEIAGVASELGADIQVAREGVTYEV